MASEARRASNRRWAAGCGSIAAAFLGLSLSVEHFGMTDLGENALRVLFGAGAVSFAGIASGFAVLAMNKQ